LVFDLSQTPLPLWTTDLRAIIVYTGQVGAISQQTAIGFKDIAEPTPIDIVNNMDFVCINGNYLSAGSQEAINAVGANIAGRPNRDIYPHRLRNVYLAFTTSPASATNYSAVFPVIQPGEHGRVFVLPDYDFTASTSETVENIFGPLDDVWGLSFIDSMYPVDGVLNQEVLEDGTYVDYYPGMYLERGIHSWSNLHYENPQWPTDTTCDRSLAPPLAGPVTVEIPP